MSSDTRIAGAGQAPERKRNRRRFLAGVATGLAALGLRRLASGDPAMAADGNPLILGNQNNCSNITQLIKDGTVNTTALEVINQATGPGGTAVFAQSWGTGGVYSPAIQGECNVDGGYGVVGLAPNGNGVFGQSSIGTGLAVLGFAADNGTGQFGTGVMGTSGATAFPPPPAIATTGVCGVSVAPSGGATAAGVVGDSTTNAGVAGFTSAPNHAAGEFTHTAGGAALKVLGPAQFAQSGLVAIAAGKKSATVTGVALRAASLVLATVQNPAGVFVQNAAPNVTGSAITISLNKAVPTGKTAKVAWFVVN